jgi:hypothetical protein
MTGLTFRVYEVDFLHLPRISPCVDDERFSKLPKVEIPHGLKLRIVGICEVRIDEKTTNLSSHSIRPRRLRPPCIHTVVVPASLAEDPHELLRRNMLIIAILQEIESTQSVAHLPSYGILPVGS